MLKLLLIAAGGAIGTLGRYLLSGYAHRVTTSAIFPVGTLTVNVLGSLIIGLLWGWFENSVLSPPLRSFLFIGILGGFTTFSTYSLETLNLLRDGELKLAFLNLVLNNILGIGFAFLGFAITKQLQH
jgi:fluoride exporter